MTANILEVRGLFATYHATAVLKSVDLDVPRGGITALLGANGAGKTTVLRAISHAMVKTHGSIALDGERIEALTSDAIARLGVAHVPDGRGTFTQLTVEENLLVGAVTRPRGADTLADVERMYALFPRLAEYRRKPAGLLSGGEQQMVAIARALMLRPRLLMLDEPSFGLAPMVVRQIFDVLAQINRDSGLSILVVEQNARLALELAHNAYVIETGRIAISGTADSLRSDPRVKTAYLGI
ncbi:ABC transporter ATP-binding protein [Variovorax sp. J22P271]|uniref:ABC transporter ATP-binding protein n=1 Tax=Variovorax davisae TaxID=3053515 RepID=UPI0025757A7C|nr:ABC transporter ATP-binding protein [Variovorax sp. J22P271]MDM0032515.1 ABC transporter ATP-binding protein [Variovorax sp. J22P271]